MSLVITPVCLEDVDIYVGGRLRSRRKRLGITQTALALRLGVTFQQVQKYEKGANRISASRLYQLSIVLDVPVTYFFEELPQMQPSDADSEALSFLREVSAGEAKKLFDLYFAASPRDRKRIVNLARTIVEL
jgi:transcriptional regulator with XRE-family HTH domain